MYAVSAARRSGEKQCSVFRGGYVVFRGRRYRSSADRTTNGGTFEYIKIYQCAFLFEHYSSLGLLW